MIPKPPDIDDAQSVDHWEKEMHQEADANGGVVTTRYGAFYDDEKRLVRLPDADATEVKADTEALLNGLIEDCRFLIREVAFHSARLTPDAQHRLEFLGSAKGLAITGAAIGKTIAKLRQNRPPEPEENRYRMIIEHVSTAPARPVRRARKGGREGGEKTR